MNKKQLIVAWVILFLLSSIAVAKQTTSPFELVKGVTTQKDVKENFGEPQTTRIESNGVVVWVFNKIKVEDLENSKKIPEAKEFILRFNKRGILIDYEIKMEKAETKDFIDLIVEAEIEDMRTGLQAWTDQKEIEKLSGITLDDEYVKKLYQEFKSVLVNPPNPDTYTKYSIKNEKEALKRAEQLGRRLHNLLMALSEEDFEKYGNLIAGMRELLYIDVKHIPLAIKGDESRVIYWYTWHNSALELIEKEYSRLFE